MATLVKGAQYLMKWGARYDYLSSDEVEDYRRALKEASEELEREAEAWDPTYRT